ncbi:hypothetical protein RUND412_000250 [Rhizina undulata]
MASRLLHRSLRPLVQPRAPLLRRTLLDHPPPPIPKQRLSRPPPKHRPPYTHDAINRSDLAAEKRRTWNLTAGAVVCMILMWVVARTQDIKAETHAGAGDIKPGLPVVVGGLSDEEKRLGVELVETGTGVPAFPKTLRMEENGEEGEYTLVGLGIRTVSFLSIQVYVIGFYIHVDDLAKVQAALLRRVQPGATTATPDERSGLRSLLRDKTLGEEFFTEALEKGGWRSVVRIVPTRNTDYQHLRDGWVRGIQARTTKSPLYDDAAFVASLSDFKALFGGHKRSVPKQKVLLLARDKDGRLSCFYDGSGRNDGRLGGEGKDGREELVKLGEVADERLSRALWLCYLAGEKVASEGARESIIDGLVGLVERPVGTTGVAVV